MINLWEFHWIFFEDKWLQLCKIKPCMWLVYCTGNLVSLPKMWHPNPDTCRYDEMPAYLKWIKTWARHSTVHDVTWRLLKTGVRREDGAEVSGENWYTSAFEMVQGSSWGKNCQEHQFLIENMFILCWPSTSYGLGMGFTSPLITGTPPSLDLCQPCEYCHSPCELMCVPALSCLEDLFPWCIWSLLPLKILPTFYSF